MEVMKSIFQVSITKEFVDLHYLLSVSAPKMHFIFNGCSGSNSVIKMCLHYRLSSVVIEIAIRPIDLLSEVEMKNAGDKWEERTMKKFEDCIRLPLVRKWEEYRKHMVE